MLALLLLTLAASAEEVEGKIWAANVLMNGLRWESVDVQPLSGDLQRKHLRVEAKGKWSPVIAVRDTRDGFVLLEDRNPDPRIFEAYLEDPREDEVQVGMEPSVAKGKFVLTMEDVSRPPRFGEAGFEMPDLTAVSKTFPLEFEPWQWLRGKYTVVDQSVDGFAVAPLEVVLPASSYKVEVEGVMLAPLVVWRIGEERGRLEGQILEETYGTLDSDGSTPIRLYIAPPGADVLDEFFLRVTPLE